MRGIERGVEDGGRERKGETVRGIFTARKINELQTDGQT